MSLPAQTFSTIQQLLTYINTVIIPNGVGEVTAEEHNNVENALANFIVSYTLNSSLAKIVSAGGAVSLDRPFTIFTAAATSITWPENVQNEYYIINATGTNIPLADISYINAFQNTVNVIPARTAIHVAKTTNGSWIQVNNLPGSGGDIPPVVNNGLSIENDITGWGQVMDSPGDPAALLENREVPMNLFTIFFKNGGSHTSLDMQGFADSFRLLSNTFFTIGSDSNYLIVQGNSVGTTANDFPIVQLVAAIQGTQTNFCGVISGFNFSVKQNEPLLLTTTPSNNGSGPAGDIILSCGRTQQSNMLSQTSIPYNIILQPSGTGVTQVTNLAGSGTRMVTTDPTGVLSTAALPLQLKVFTGSSPVTDTMPALGSGASFIVKNKGSAVYTLQGAGSDNFYQVGALPQLVLNPGDGYVVADDGTHWTVV